MTTPCAGCLGDTVCWVCLGTGAADTVARMGGCRSCGGSAVCRYCTPAVIVLDLVDVVPVQREPYGGARVDRRRTPR